MLFSMLIVIIAYFPLLSLQYIEGLLFVPMAITLCFALLGALLIALYLVPVLATFLFKAGVRVHEKNIFDRLTTQYRAALPHVIAHRKRIIVACGSIFALVLIFILPHLGTEFLPYMDEGVFWIRANFPEGISLKENSQYGNQLRKILHEFPEVSFATTQTGRNDAGTDPFPTDRIEMMIGLKDRSEWTNYSRKLDLEAAIQRRLSEEFPTTRLQPHAAAYR